MKTSLKINQHQDDSNFEISFKLIDFIAYSSLKRGVVQQVSQFFNVILMVDFQTIDNSSYFYSQLLIICLLTAFF